MRYPPRLLRGHNRVDALSSEREPSIAECFPEEEPSAARERRPTHSDMPTSGGRFHSGSLRGSAPIFWDCARTVSQVCLAQPHPTSRAARADRAGGETDACAPTSAGESSLVVTGELKR